MERDLLDDIGAMVYKLSAKIQAPRNLLPDIGKQMWYDNRYIAVDTSGLMCYVTSERGVETRKKTDNRDELLYWIFEAVSFSMACRYELKNRVEDQDCRRIMFAKQEELLGMLSESWQQKTMQKHRQILEEHPFNDVTDKIGISEL